MPINHRSFALSIAVTWFFINAFIGWVQNVEPLTCGRKAMVGGILVYIVCSIAVKIINKIIIDAVVSHHVDPQEGNIE